VRQTALNLVPLMSTEKPQTKSNARVEEIPVDEERPYSAEKGDEALDLVGAERSAQFSDEYFLKLRRKLVRASTIRCSSKFSPSLLSGSLDPTPCCCCLLYTVPVRCKWMRHNHLSDHLIVTKHP
jgi:hypothetical protein